MESESDVVGSESGVLSVEESNVTYHKFFQNPKVAGLYQSANEDPDILVTVIDAFCQICYSGDLV